jgi:hypothetical protein
MKRQEIINVVKAYRGEILATISGNNDVHYVRVVKSSLLEMLANIADDELEARKTNDILFIDRAG